LSHYHAMALLPKREHKEGKKKSRLISLHIKMLERQKKRKDSQIEQMKYTF